MVSSTLTEAQLCEIEQRDAAERASCAEPTPAMADRTRLLATVRELLAGPHPPVVYLVTDAPHAAPTPWTSQDGAQRFASEQFADQDYLERRTVADRIAWIPADELMPDAGVLEMATGVVSIP